jgi:two-component system, sensor histidine kinase and response regulator
MNTPKILIVDDESAHLEAIVDACEEMGNTYHVLQAFSGKTAYDIAETEIPNLIITDWEMPEMNGIELIEKLKSNEKTRDIPVIMCTGVMTDSKNLETALKAGAVDYIRKPIDKIELLARTNANLNLANSYIRIKKLNESKDTFFSILAHDLKSPVGNIKALLELILSEESDFNQENLRHFLTLLGKQSTAAFNILDNLLVWAKSQRDNVEFAPKEQKLNLAIDNNIDLLENIAIKKGITLINETKDIVFSVFDLPLISIVVRNLLANAIKFTYQNGSITINTAQDESQTIVSISDTGTGISDERIEKLFDESQFETTYGTENEKGSGLGLKLCKHFVEQHNGKIWVESELEKGSSFKFTLPR